MGTFAKTEIYHLKNEENTKNVGKFRVESPEDGSKTWYSLQLNNVDLATLKATLDTVQTLIDSHTEGGR